MTKVTRKVGRPPKWESVDDLLPLINEYLEETPREELTVTGLALAIGTTRKTLIEYAESKEDFGKVIKEAKTIIENSYEIALRRHGRSGDIFGLKNFGWVDKTETDITTKGKSITPEVAANKAADILGRSKPKEEPEVTTESEND